MQILNIFPVFTAYDWLALGPAMKIHGPANGMRVDGNPQIVFISHGPAGQRGLPGGS